jgi:hypothetical protein
MTWRRALLYWGCFVTLAAYYVAVLYEPAPPAAAHLTRAPFIDVPEQRIEALEVRRGDALVRCRRVDGRWQVVVPAGSSVPSDLVAALITSVVQLPDVEVVEEVATDLPQFGLDPPLSQLTLKVSGGAPIVVRIGNRNPSSTAVYAQRDDSRQVLLIGLNVRYYEDLLFEALHAQSAG